jgi:hypothetical protein
VIQTLPLSSISASLGVLLELFLLADGREDPMPPKLNA